MHLTVKVLEHILHKSLDRPPEERLLLTTCEQLHHRFARTRVSVVYKDKRTITGAKTIIQGYDTRRLDTVEGKVLDGRGDRKVERKGENMHERG